MSVVPSFRHSFVSSSRKLYLYIYVFYPVVQQRYYRNRFKKVIPVFFFFSLFSTFLIGLVKDDSAGIVYRSFVVEFLWVVLYFDNELLASLIFA